MNILDFLKKESLLTSIRVLKLYPNYRGESDTAQRKTFVDVMAYNASIKVLNG